MPHPSQLPSEPEFEEWLGHPITQLFKNYFLNQWKQSLMEQWGAGTFQGSTPNITFSANAQALGQVELLKQLSELDYQKFFEVLKDERE